CFLRCARGGQARGPVSLPMAHVGPRILPADTIIERRPDGTIHARSPYPLGPYPSKITERLEYWADVAPSRVFLASRNEAGRGRTVRARVTIRLGAGSRHLRAAGRAAVDGICRLRGHTCDRRGRRGARPGDAFDGGETPLHLRIDRAAQGGNQHAADALFEPG